MAKRYLLAATLAIIAGPIDRLHAGSLSPEELATLGKSLSFMQPAVQTDIPAAVVYSGDSADSQKDAESILTASTQAKLAGTGLRRLSLVEARALASAEYSLIILAAGTTGEDVARAARTRHVLCVTGDVPAVVAGRCVIGIRSGQRVELLLNAEAAKAAGLTFANAFRMMVHEQ